MVAATITDNARKVLQNFTPEQVTDLASLVGMTLEEVGITLTLAPSEMREQLIKSGGVLLGKPRNGLQNIKRVRPFCLDLIAEAASITTAVAANHLDEVAAELAKSA